MLALIPVIASLLPNIVSWFTPDPKGQAIAQAASTVVQTLTGASDASSAQAALDKDPELKARVLSQLAAIHAQATAEAHKADVDEVVARLTDVANARAQTIDLAKAGSSIAWGAPLVSLVVLTIFGSAAFVVVRIGVPAGSEMVANVMLGSLATMATSVVAYWMGSSSGSASKQKDLVDMAKSVSQQVPATLAEKLVAGSADALNAKELERHHAG